jgi:hypothetical protein
MAQLTVGEWVAKSHARLDAVWKTAAQDIAAEVQTPVAKNGRMPVRTGFLRNSFGAEINSTPSGNGETPYTSGPISIVLNRAKLGDRVVFGWAAKYSVNMEAKYSFVRHAAQNWTQIVNKAARKVKARVNR